MTLPIHTGAMEEIGCALGIDIGGTKIAIGVITPHGRILRKAASPHLSTRII